MKFRLAAACLLLITAAISSAQADEKSDAEWRKKFDESILPLLKDKCFKCHNAEKREADLDLARFDNGEKAFKKLDVWEEVAKRVRTNEMPPEGSPRLDDEHKGQFLQWLDRRPQRNLCNQLASDETTSWYRGYVMSRRLTRTEYGNAMRDLFGIELHAAEKHPSDGSGGLGFDTSGDALFTSTLHIERYLASAVSVLERIASDVPPKDPAIHAARERLLNFENKPAQTDRSGAKEIVSRLARRAWRRPVAEEEIERLLSLYDRQLQRGGSHMAALRQSLAGVLVSPHFLFVVEAEPEAGGVQRLNPHELAVRLALFLWSSIPDAELSAAADNGSLHDAEKYLAQVRRMIRDPKARALGENFGLQWLGLTSFVNSPKLDAQKFPEFDRELAEAMRDEAIETVAGVFREDRNLLELLDADTTFVNARLAKHYGLEPPVDNAWQRVTLPDRRRGGVAAMGAVLVSTSYPLRTSPVLRGKWILEEILGSKVPSPPPNVPALEETKAEGKSLTLRERLELHRQKSECASCHNRMDPLGFGLENFDPLGRWRTEDEGRPIDAAGKMPSGDHFVGAEEMKRLLHKRREEFLRHFTRKLMSYALGRDLNQFDDCVIREAKEKLAKNGDRASMLLEEIAVSYPFQYRYYKREKK